MAASDLTDEAIRATAKMKLEAMSQREAARELGVSREALLGLAAGTRVRAGTFALARAHLAETQRDKAA